ncbi:hypothetical protein CU103_23525 [Phyllobacterium sophorae]|uniref:Uncharacterized protein n=1 Tax=Phyllobacterium sophorae TaxID=1520277 RepID=A0A2P7B4G0_9HYPH|nr:hypothetical protein CU103_23525 [Phyllobacterium sophorae]
MPGPDIGLKSGFYSEMHRDRLGAKLSFGGEAAALCQPVQSGGWVSLAEAYGQYAVKTWSEANVVSTTKHHPGIAKDPYELDTQGTGLICIVLGLEVGFSLPPDQVHNNAFQIFSNSAKCHL